MPITVGQLDNVPAPGDPIRSPWAQEISGYVVHPFPSLATLTAGWASPPNGSLAMTLDTGYQYQRRGGAWEQINPRPALFTALSGTGMTGIGATITDIAGLTVAFTALAGHRYLVSAVVTVLQAAAGGGVGIYLTDGTNRNIQQSFSTVALNAYATIATFGVDAPTAGAITYKVRASTTAGGVSINQGTGAPSTLLVQDLGP